MHLGVLRKVFAPSRPILPCLLIPQVSTEHPVPFCKLHEIREHDSLTDHYPPPPTAAGTGTSRRPTDGPND